MIFRDPLTKRLVFCTWTTHERTGAALLVSGLFSRVILPDEARRLESVELGDQDRVRLAHYLREGNA